MDYATLKSIMSDPIKWGDICRQTEFLNELYTVPSARQRLWHIENNTFEVVQCITCGAPRMGFSAKLKSYSRYCNSTCAQKDPAIRQKTEATCIQKYGATSNLKTSENKTKEKATKLAKYGNESCLRLPEFQRKVKATNLLRYGVTNPSMSPIIRSKIDATNFTKYNRKRSSQSHLPQDVIDLKNNKDEMTRWFVELKMPVTEIAKILGVNHSQLCSHFKTNLGIDITRHAVSSHERQLCQFLDELGVEYEASNRSIVKPKELDIVIHSHKLAIELNGLAWHSELRGKDSNYHLNKTTACAAQGYRLVHIWSSEWINTPLLVKSRIRSMLGMSTRIMARKCQIATIDPTDTAQFLTANHMQGYCQSKVRLGLRYNGELVAVMTFGKSRFNKSIQWELLRYCSKQTTNVVGGASKLLAAFKEQFDPESIVSYCDLRWNTGTLYKKLGFRYSHRAGPNFWYTRNYTSLESRIRYQKYKLAALLAKFDPTATAWDNMVANGYDRVWDCGNEVFEWRRK